MDVKARVEFHLQLRFARYSRMFLQLGYSIWRSCVESPLVYCKYMSSPLAQHEFQPQAAATTTHNKNKTTTETKSNIIIIIVIHRQYKGISRVGRDIQPTVG